MRTAVPTAACGGGWSADPGKCTPPASLSRVEDARHCGPDALLMCSSVVAPAGPPYASAEGSPVRGWTGWTTHGQRPEHRRYPRFVEGAGAACSDPLDVLLTPRRR